MTLRKSYPPAFESLWREYPNKANKLGAFKAWEKHVAEGDREELLQHVIERARFDAQWQRGFIPHLQSFINGARWEDDYKRIPKPRYHPSFNQEAGLSPWEERGITEGQWREICNQQKDEAMRQLRGVFGRALH